MKLVTKKALQQNLLVIYLIASRLLWSPAVCMENANLSANPRQPLLLVVEKLEKDTNQKEPVHMHCKNSAQHCSQHFSNSKFTLKVDGQFFNFSQIHYHYGIVGKCWQTSQLLPCKQVTTAIY